MESLTSILTGEFGDDEDDHAEIINNLSYGGLQPELRDLVTT